MTPWLRVTMGVALGLLTSLLLFPFAGTDDLPPHHYSVFGNEVPTGSLWLALTAGVLATAVAWVLTGWIRRARPGLEGRIGPEGT